MNSTKIAEGTFISCAIQRPKYKTRAYTDKRKHKSPKSSPKSQKPTAKEERTLEKYTCEKNCFKKEEN